MNHDKLLKLTLAAMFAAMSFVCFTYLRIEIPMGAGLPGKIYIGAAFIMLSSFLLGAKYGGLTGAIGLTLGDILVGYVTSAPPTFVAKLIYGLACGIMAHHVFHLARAKTKARMYMITAVSGLVAGVVNVLTEPVIRWAFKTYILGLPQEVAYVSAVNCAISMAVNALPSIFFAVILYGVAMSTVFKNRKLLVED
ncbi:MAG: ECF transporter S component [Anaerovibrio sp.]